MIVYPGRPQATSPWHSQHSIPTPHSYIALIQHITVVLLLYNTSQFQESLATPCGVFQMRRRCLLKKVDDSDRKFTRPTKHWKIKITHYSKTKTHSLVYSCMIYFQGIQVLRSSYDPEYAHTVRNFPQKISEMFCHSCPQRNI